MRHVLDSTQRLVEAPAFEFTIIAIIILNGALLGLGTSPTLSERYGELIRIGSQIALAIFIVEALLKMVSASPRVAGYFKDGWNIFDFLVIVFALIPATGQFAMIARLARLLRVLRLISTIRDLRLIVAALVPINSKRGARHDADEHHCVYLRHHGLSSVSRKRP